jgi:hypothetical protein
VSHRSYLNRKCKCVKCGKPYRPSRADQEYCSGSCRTAASRAAAKAQEQAEALFRIERNTVASTLPYHFPDPDRGPDRLEAALRARSWGRPDYDRYRYPGHVAKLPNPLRRKLLLLRNG